MKSTSKIKLSFFRRVFIDTSAWLRIGLRKEYGYKEAVKLYKEIVTASKLYTSTYVIDEVLTRLITRQIFIEAKRFHERVYIAERNQALNIIRVDAEEEILKKAWHYFEKFREHRISFTDATTIAIIKQEKIDAVFSFDSDFTKIGLQIIPLQ